MNRNTKFALPFILGVGLTTGLMLLLGAAAPQDPKTDRETQLVPIAGGLAIVLAITDQEKDKLYLYKLPAGKDGGNVELKGSIDLSATGQKQLPAELDLD
jgi:hypothetical protein